MSKMKKENMRGVGIFYLLIFLFLLYGFQFTGRPEKVFTTPDNVSVSVWHAYIEDAKKFEEYPIWNPYLFMGMPNYLVTGANYPVQENFFKNISPRLITINLKPVLLLYFFLFGIMLFFNKNYWRTNFIVIILINALINTVLWW